MVDLTGGSNLIPPQESFVFPPAPLYPNGNLSLALGPDTFSLPCDSNNIGKPGMNLDPKFRCDLLMLSPCRGQVPEDALPAALSDS